MKKVILISLFCISAIFSSCKKDDDGVLNITLVKGTVTSSSIAVSWNKIDNEYVSYQVEYAITGQELETATFLGNIDSSSTVGYEFYELNPNTEYTIKVTAFSFENELSMPTLGEGSIKIKTSQAE